MYSFATCVLTDQDGRTGTGYTLTLGRGNEIVTKAIECFASQVIGIDIPETVREFGAPWSAWSNDSQLRWLGPTRE